MELLVIKRNKKPQNNYRYIKTCYPTSRKYVKDVYITKCKHNL